ncbi:hypothetical protein EYC80_007062 [Monilinia laxa]|uniref:Uncharacterized protein n=1 Tax=Monilinia laxa TaxID=61186 RepID=A0A5N6K0G9_MONLA|nr:hypothetical protein EYC80_007062 [Monilinia laxa]
MVQGALKSTKSALAGGNRANGAGKKAALGPKKGQRVIKAKREGLMRSEILRKKHSAGLTAMTEKTLGAKAGHLELLGVGKKKGWNKEVRIGVVVGYWDGNLDVRKKWLNLTHTGLEFGWRLGYDMTWYGAYGNPN